MTNNVNKSKCQSIEMTLLMRRFSYCSCNKIRNQVTVSYNNKKKQNKNEARVLCFRVCNYLRTAQNNFRGKVLSSAEIMTLLILFCLLTSKRKRRNVYFKTNVLYQQFLINSQEIIVRCSVSFGCYCSHIVFFRPRGKEGNLLIRLNIQLF